jgi:glycosyltransferase involved in cell wall biosynthesis
MSLERRLLVVTESLGVGGTESHLLRLLPRLSDLGWKVAVFCLSGRGDRAAQLEANNIELLSSRRSVGENGSSRRHPKRIALAAGSLFRFMHQWRPQIAHFYLPGPYVVGAPIALTQGVPVNVMSRRSLSVYQQNWPMVAGIERVLHRRMDALIGNSRAVVTQLIDEGGPKHRVQLIYNGVEVREALPARPDARRELGIDGNALVGVAVANLIHYKGHVDLIKGLGSIAPKLPPHWLVLLAGRDEGLGKKLKELAEYAGVAEHVHFLGQRSDVDHLLAAADFGLLTSHEEGFSNVILESMRAALPMVVTDVGGNPEAVLNGETGLVIPAHSPNAIGDAVFRLANDPALRKRLGVAGKERVRLEFSLEKCVTAHAELYDQLLAKALHRAAPATSPPHVAPTYVPSKRPLMLAYWGRYGALPQLTLELAKACQRAGRDAETTISVSTSNELYDQYLSLGEAVFPVVTYPSALSAANYRAAGRVRTSLRQRLSEDGTRAFVTLMPHVWSPLAAPILKKNGVRHTVIVHDADPHRGDTTAFINRWLMREAQSADQVVTLTAAVAERLSQQKLIPEGKISVLFHPDLTYSTSRRRENGPLRVLFFGRILPYKGLSLFVDAMELLKQSGPAIEIGVFGQGNLGPDRQRLERVNAEVVNRWIDPQQIADILGRHDVVVVSHTEASQSGVIAAAHGAGLPVVATPVGGLREQIIPGVTGLVTETVTAHAIADAVRRLAEDRILLNRLREGIAATKPQRSMDEFFSALSVLALGGSIKNRTI